MSKKTLTLSIEEKIKNRAKRYAEANGLSISQIVEEFLSTLADDGPTDEEIYREQQMAEAGMEDWAENLE